MSRMRVFKAGPVLAAVFWPFNVFVQVGSLPIFLREPAAVRDDQSAPAQGQKNEPT